jgi:hypothetical protein
MSASQPADPGQRRQVLIDDIFQLLRRARDGKLDVLRQFLQVPNGRVFLPRSSQGPALFSRIVDLDALFARAEQQLMRTVDPLAGYETKARLERDLCELHVLLIELCADLAATYRLEATDPAVLAAMKRRRAAPAGEADGATSNPVTPHAATPHAGTPSARTPNAAPPSAATSAGPAVG